MSKRVFVGNLSFNISEEELQAAFASYGATGAQIPRNDNGRPKGFGFVDVADDQLEAAVSGMQGKELDGRAIDVSEAKPRPPLNTFGNRQGGFGGRGGGGGGRGRW